MVKLVTIVNIGYIPLVIFFLLVPIDSFGQTSWPTLDVSSSFKSIMEINENIDAANRTAHEYNKGKGKSLLIGLAGAAVAIPAYFLIPDDENDVDYQSKFIASTVVCGIGTLATYYPLFKRKKLDRLKIKRREYIENANLELKRLNLDPIESNY